MLYFIPENKGISGEIGESWQQKILAQPKVLEAEEYCMYPQGVCRIRKPAYAGNGCAIFPAFRTARMGQKIRRQPKTIDSEIP